MLKLLKAASAFLAGTPCAAGTAATRRGKSSPASATVIVLLLTVAIGSAAWPSGNQSYPARSMTPVMAAQNTAKNTCADAAISSTSKALTQENMQQLIDGDVSTGVDASALPGASLEIRFRARPPWLNIVSITHRGSMDFKLSVEDIYKHNLEIPFTREVTDKGNGLIETRLTCEDLRITALLIEPLAGLPGIDNVDSLLEIEAYYITVDPDGGRDGDGAEVGDWYIQWYTSGPCLADASNLRKAKGSAQKWAARLVDNLPFVWENDWGNNLAFSQDFTTHDEIAADRLDFAGFFGHGSPAVFWLSHDVFDCGVHYSGCQYRWGTQDLEWVAIIACNSLTDTTLGGWYGCFNGLHLICGCHSVVYGNNMGEYFGNRLKDGQTIPQAWFNAFIKIHRNSSRWKTAMVLAEAPDNFEDHVHYAGPMSPDRPHDGVGHWWSYSVRSGKAPESEPGFDRATAQLIAAPNTQSPAFLVPRDILDRSPAESMPQMIATTEPVSYGWVFNLAQSICGYYNIFCGVQEAEIVWDPETGVYSAYDGPHELHVDGNSGAWEYLQSEAYATLTTSAPLLPTEADAGVNADAFLTAIGYLCADAVPYETSWMRQVAYDFVQQMELVDSSWDMSIARGYARVNGGYPIVGPGAKLLVEYGDGGELQFALCGGWREIVAGQMVSTISLSDALQDMAQCGAEIALDRVPLCDTFLVDSAYLGYYEAIGDTLINELEIVWIIDGRCLFSHDNITDTTDYQLLIPARFRHPQAIITEPASDTTIFPGESILLTGGAIYGTQPYEYLWYSDLDGLIDSGQATETNELSGRADGRPAIHCIWLEVVDANQQRDFASVNVTIYCCLGIRGNVDYDPDDQVDISDLVFVVDYMFSGGPPPPCSEEADVNGDSVIDISDLVHLADYMFTGGEPPYVCNR